MSKYDDMGFVTLEDVVNVFSMQTRELDEKLRTSMPTLEARGELTRVVEFFEETRHELMRRARANIKDYVLHNPAVKREARAAQAEASAESTRMSHEERVRRNRERARLGEA